MQLDISVRQASGLKHTGKHCVEFTLDGHDPTRTQWVEDEQDAYGIVVEPKQFRQAGRGVVNLRGGVERYKDAWLHVAVIHQRMIRQDKRAAEAHIPFQQAAAGFSDWIALEHKSQFGGKLYMVIKLIDRAPGKAKTNQAAASQSFPWAMPSTAATAAPREGLSPMEIEEQRAILASIQAAASPKAGVDAAGKTSDGSFAGAPVNSTKPRRSKHDANKAS
eukprot:CAMPEP_0117585594 /NCGR_PEP_ID=MMETSP0784-20121206/68233_1 /TAXON_ID=39447 /ORGANISM="" /LENGTH=219 /DNA_ID=CAMNT_0005386561 /DNA_START=1 /DNA_END=656 /DNA_ORIENTATION=-